MQPNVYEIQAMDFFKSGNSFTGSRNGLRYKVEPWQKEEGEKCFLVTLWPEPLCFEKTPDHQKETAVFPFTAEGREQVIGYLAENDAAQIWQQLALRKPAPEAADDPPFELETPEN
ncbi:MAG: GNAT family acetyltransferase [Oscillospiraceae bacterium]|nr:GNAT family acetyltransferase [Oscillospiraceae bacterium]